MSDTPRTDAEIELWSGQDVAFDRMCDFSTKLELELAAERQKVAEAYGALEASQKQAKEWHDQLAALRERDEKDARRYRWLKTRMTYRDFRRETAMVYTDVRHWYHETYDRKTDTIDALIDAARDGEGSPERKQ